MTKQALDYFQRAARLDPDVSATCRSASGASRRPSRSSPLRAVAVGADDEFDRAFDDILGHGKS